MGLPSYTRLRIAASLLLLCAVAACAQPAHVATNRDQPLRILLVGDPFAAAIKVYRAELAAQLDHEVVIDVVGYNEIYDLTLLNAKDAVSHYDIVSFDVVWIGEYAAADVLLPLNGFIAASPELRVEDYLPKAYQASGYEGAQFGLPIQPHPELLWYHTKRLKELGLTPPQTTDELLTFARKLTDPARDRYGICWNAQRGQALGQQMAHFYAAFGQPLLAADGKPTLNTPAGIQAARFARDLLAASPPDILAMAWDERIRRFSEGTCAMTYGWAARTYLAEDVIRSVDNQIGFVGAPHSPASAPVTPLGTWSLGIPSNIGSRKAIAWQALHAIAMPETTYELAMQGNGGTVRRSLLSNPTLQSRYPAFATVAELSDRDELADWMRPAVPYWYDLAEILGTVYYSMLRGELSPEAAAAEAQRQAEYLLMHGGGGS